MKHVEIETNRTTMNAKQFYQHCSRLFKKKGYSIEDWTNWHDWSRGSHIPRTEVEYHSDYYGDVSVIYRYEPYHLQEYGSHDLGGHNLILEWDEGHGYMYFTTWTN